MPAAVSRPLEVLGTAPLSPEQLGRLRAIEEYDLWFVVERLEQKGGVAPHLIPQAVMEFRKYVALVALGHTEIGMPSREVDEVWHSFILFTREYGDFCRRACGRFIHHRPNTSRRPQLPSASVADFNAAYTEYFGELPPIWRGVRAWAAAAGRGVGAGAASTAVSDCDADTTGPGVLMHAATVSLSDADCDTTQSPHCDSAIEGGAPAVECTSDCDPVGATAGSQVAVRGADCDALPGPPSCDASVSEGIDVTQEQEGGAWADAADCDSQGGPVASKVDVAGPDCDATGGPADVY